MADLHFDEASHVYTLTGEGGGETRLLSVSQILQKADMYGYPKTATSHEKMAFGTHVHKLTEMADDGIISHEDLEDRERGHVQAYERFKAEYDHEIIHTELPIYHPTYLYAGKLDRIITRREHRYSTDYVLEIKTGQPHPANKLQLAAYHEAYNAMPEHTRKVSGAMAVYLKDDGTFKLVHTDSHEVNFSLFLSCLQIIRWRDKHGIGKARGSNGTR